MRREPLVVKILKQLILTQRTPTLPWNREQLWQRWAGWAVLETASFYKELNSHVLIIQRDHIVILFDMIIVCFPASPTWCSGVGDVICIPILVRSWELSIPALLFNELHPIHQPILLITFSGLLVTMEYNVFDCWLFIIVDTMKTC